ncbi:hypothetical protein PCS_02227 [Desulfocurvibacter africanus PCS]|uniref:Uncharacterized protein n=2 Tax=Desulfocurvibacter africanus TaxID=873 RepID=F3YY04_DESAF|nr:hypothetical protein Desaf_2382 [Desulfocurvibacter africanus subsp. africanus str. Walvis Bay]EMG37089.1 hypothetical protein PCS_02227 [Desulfocurvibacter africanus PCS]
MRRIMSAVRCQGRIFFILDCTEPSGPGKKP